MKAEVVRAVAVVNDSAVVVTNLFDNSLVARWLRFSAVSEKSVQTYTLATRQMFRYFAVNGISKPAREDLENWRDSLIAAGKSPATVQLYLTSCKLFFRFLSMENLYPNIADHLKSRCKVNHEHKKDALTAAQSKTLLKAIQGDSLKALRDRAILALMLTAGLRTIEIERADVADVYHFNGVTFLRVLGKGRTSKSESVRIAPQVENLINAYLAARGTITDDSPLFTSCARRNFGARISTQTIRKMVKANLRGIGLDSKRLSAHSLRHSAALQMLLNGAELTQVQQVLRHTNINTTMIYNHSIERFRNQSECLAANAIFGTC